MKAIVIGATGATGKNLVERLLADQQYTQVVVFVRKDAGLTHPRLTTHIINFDDIASWQDLVRGDVLFSALGTTLKAAGSKDAQWKIDYDYQYNFAKVAKDNGVRQCVLVSAMGANTKSLIFYSQMKGRLEEAIKALGFQRFVILQPPILVRKGSDRSGENIGVNVIRFLNKLGLLRSQKPMPTEILADAMLRLSKSPKEGIFTFKGQEIITES